METNSSGKPYVTLAESGLHSTISDYNPSDSLPKFYKEYAGASAAHVVKDGPTPILIETANNRKMYADIEKTGLSTDSSSGNSRQFLK